MALFRRKPPLPEAHHDAWWTFLDCAQAVEAGRRVLLRSLPTGRVEPAPLAVGAEAIRIAVADVRSWMPGWRRDELADEWEHCSRALDESEVAVDELPRVAADTRELEELLEAVGAVVAPLDAFADAEAAWRRRWRLPADADRTRT